MLPPWRGRRRAFMGTALISALEHAGSPVSE